MAFGSPSRFEKVAIIVSLSTEMMTNILYFKKKVISSKCLQKLGFQVCAKYDANDEAKNIAAHICP